MSTCPHCKMSVGGEFRKCPLCQSSLKGDQTELYWPAMTKLKVRSFYFKLVLFAVIVGIVICLALDFLILPPQKLHWSILVSVWGIVGLWLFTRYFKNHRIVSKILFQTMLALSLLVIWTEYFLGFTQYKFSIDYVVPILCSGVLIANFVFSFLRFHFAQDTMIYMLFNILIGIIPYIALFLHSSKAPLTWTICLLISIITFVGICIFQGRQMIIEIQKRFHF